MVFCIGVPVSRRRFLQLKLSSTFHLTLMARRDKQDTLINAHCVGVVTIAT